jgi:selenocysteine lyase/cysteine desulfurase
VGWAWIEQREQALAKYLRAQLRTIPGVHVLTPEAWEHASAITSFCWEGIDAQPLHAALWQQRIVTRWVPERNAIRISTPYFVFEQDIDRLVAALVSRAKSGRAHD